MRLVCASCFVTYNQYRIFIRNNQLIPSFNLTIMDQNVVQVEVCVSQMSHQEGELCPCNTDNSMCRPQECPCVCHPHNSGHKRHHEHEHHEHHHRRHHHHHHKNGSESSSDSSSSEDDIVVDDEPVVRPPVKFESIPMIQKQVKQTAVKSTSAPTKAITKAVTKTAAGAKKVVTKAVTKSATKKA